MRRALGAAISVAAIVAGLTGLVLLITGKVGSNGDGAVAQLLYFIASPINAAVGGLLVLRRPDHWGGWTLVGIGASSSIDLVCQGVLSHWLRYESWTYGIAPWAAWFDNWLWPSFFATLLYVILKFAGHDRRTQWLRRIGWSGMVILAAITLAAMTVKDSSTTGPHRLETAINLGVPLKTVNSSIGGVLVLALGTMICALIAMLLHWRVATGVDRAQVRWLLWSFALSLGILLMQAVVDGAFALLGISAPYVDEALSIVQDLSLLTIPGAIFVSVTRFGLFEIDRIASRTATYTVLTATLTISYAVIVTSVTRLLPDSLGSIGVAAATLAVAALFLPARRRLIALMDRRFNRRLVNAEHVVAHFAERMRLQDSVDPYGAELLTAVGQVFEPVSAGVWLTAR